MFCGFHIYIFLFIFLNLFIYFFKFSYLFIYLFYFFFKLNILPVINNVVQLYGETHFLHDIGILYILVFIIYFQVHQLKEKANSEELILVF